MFLTVILDLIVFFIFITIIVFVKDKFIIYFEKQGLKSFSNWLPIEQTMELRQLFYLIFIALLVTNLYYLILINTSFNYLINYVIFDFLISVCAAVYIFDKKNIKQTFVLLFTLVPLTGYSFTGYIGGMGMSIFLIFEIIHSLGIIATVLFVIQDFRRYSSSHRLGYTILLLFMIIVICTIFTCYAENVSLLDGVVYCSNAFTSNGYGLVNADNYQGKIISIILVWAGYILSGVSTALLTITLMANTYKKRIRVMKKRMDLQDKRLKEMNKKLDELLNR